MLILLVWSYYSLNSDHFSSNNESGAAMLAFYMIYCPFIISSIQHCCSWNWNEFSEFSQEMTILTFVSWSHRCVWMFHIHLVARADFSNSFRKKNSQCHQKWWQVKVILSNCLVVISQLFIKLLMLWIRLKTIYINNNNSNIKQTTAQVVEYYQMPAKAPVKVARFWLYEK